uniref:Uncharacterized protein n=1 Tax=Arundo donax TaxID=35708 RepID=A0A0A9G0Q4_ARUDO
MAASVTVNDTLLYLFKLCCAH